MSVIGDAYAAVLEEATAPLFSTIQPKGTAVTATTGGGTTGLIPQGSAFVTVTSDDANKQITLPIANVGTTIKISTGATGCELIAVDVAHKANNVTIGATNELALAASCLFHCTYVAGNNWTIYGYNNLGAALAALVPDAL